MGPTRRPRGVRAASDNLNCSSSATPMRQAASLSTRPLWCRPRCRTPNARHSIPTAHPSSLRQVARRRRVASAGPRARADLRGHQRRLLARHSRGHSAQPDTRRDARLGRYPLRRNGPPAARLDRHRRPASATTRRSISV